MSTGDKTEGSFRVFWLIDGFVGRSPVYRLKEDALKFEKVACKMKDRCCIVKDLDEDETIYWTGNREGRPGIKRLENFYKNLGNLKYDEAKPQKDKKKK